MPSMDPMSEIDASTLAPLRDYLETCWADWKGRNWPEERQKQHPLSASMCRLSSVFFVELMHRAGHKEWKVAGGYAKPTMFDADVIRYARVHGRPGGFRDAGGIFHDHNWATDGVHIIDFTADQFEGAPDILVVPENDERFVPNFKSLRHAKIDCDSALLWARAPEADCLIPCVEEFLLNISDIVVPEADVLQYEP